jgi:hypothetical protein
MKDTSAQDLLKPKIRIKPAPPTTNKLEPLSLIGLKPIRHQLTSGFIEIDESGWL